MSSRDPTASLILFHVPQVGRIPASGLQRVESFSLGNIVKELSAILDVEPLALLV